MAHLEVNASWVSSAPESFEDSFNLLPEESTPAYLLAMPEVPTSSLCHNSNIPKPPPLPGLAQNRAIFSRRPSGYSCVPREMKDQWNKLFEDGYRADVHVLTDNKAIIPAHSSVLGVASPVLHNILNQSKVKGPVQHIEIHGVPCEAVRVFIRFLYSSCYEKDVMNRFVLHLLVLAHTFSVPSLKRVCSGLVEQAFLTTDNVIDVLQLARQCDTPRLSLVCALLVVKNFKTVSASEGWKVMKQANPELEQELLESVVEADSRKQDKLRKIEERKIYLQLYDAMEALLHICRDGCKTIGPRDKVLKGSQVTCRFPACKGLECLVRHFSICKTRVPGGCVQCKRMWQLLELHSRMCCEPVSCKVPLCRHFKEKMQHQNKKDETKWKLLVSKVMAAKNAPGSFLSARSRSVS